MSKKHSAVTSPKRGRGDNRRQVILDATLKLIADGGVDSVTHRRVAAAADIPLGSTTYYFESREHLIRAAFDHYLELSRGIRANIKVDPALGIDSLLDALMALLGRELEDRPMLLAEYEMTLYAARDPLLAAALHRWDESMQADLTAMLNAIGAHAPVEAARSILHLIRGYELDWLTRSNPDDENLRHRLRVLVSAYLSRAS